MVVQSAERAGDVSALLFLDFEHQVADIPWHRVHPESVKASLQHVGLNPGLMEWCCPLADGDIRVLPEEEVYLLEGATVCLDPVEAAHVDDRRTHLAKLVNPGDIFARALPHIPVNQGELYFSSHFPNKFLL